jgi:hypothetical protein
MLLCALWFRDLYYLPFVLIRVSSHGLQYQADGEIIMGKAGQLPYGVTDSMLNGEDQI